MPFGYFGNILHVNLSTKETWVEHPKESFYRTYCGGRVLALYYMLDQMKPHTDPLSPDNLLIFAPVVLTGTLAPVMIRYTFCAKSPLTGARGKADMTRRMIREELADDKIRFARIGPAGENLVCIVRPPLYDAGSLPSYNRTTGYFQVRDP